MRAILLMKLDELYVYEPFHFCPHRRIKCILRSNIFTNLKMMTIQIFQKSEIQHHCIIYLHWQIKLKSLPKDWHLNVAWHFCDLILYLNGKQTKKEFKKARERGWWPRTEKGLDLYSHSLKNLSFQFISLFLPDSMRISVLCCVDTWVW